MGLNALGHRPLAEAGSVGGRAPQQEGPLVSLTTQTLSDPARLRAALKTVRREQFATAIDELELGLAAIAAPVRGAGGEVLAALSISGPTIRMTPARIRELKPILITEADALSRRLGHHEEGEHAA